MHCRPIARYLATKLRGVQRTFPRSHFYGVRIGWMSDEIVKADHPMESMNES